YRPRGERLGYISLKRTIITGSSFSVRSNILTKRVLLAARVRLHELRRDQLHIMAKCRNHSGPIVGSACCFHRNYTSWDASEEIGQLFPSQPSLQNRFTPRICSVHLKYVLCDIQPDHLCRHLGRTSSAQPTTRQGPY